MTRCRLLLAFLAFASPLAWPVLLFADSGVPPQGLDEYQVKAAFLFNFAKFTSWPVSGDAAGPFVVGIAGDESFAARVTAVIKGKKVHGRDLEVRRISESEEPQGCHILFIAERASRRRPELARGAAKLGILTVGEAPHFIREGGMVRFFVDASRLRFQINSRTAEEAGLKISSQLLSLAAP